MSVIHFVGKGPEIPKALGITGPRLPYLVYRGGCGDCDSDVVLFQPDEKPALAGQVLIFHDIDCPVIAGNVSARYRRHR